MATPKKHDVWEVSASTIDEHFSLHPSIDHITAISIQKNTVQQIERGHQINIALPDAPTFNATITKRYTTENSLILVGAEASSNIIMTSGSNSLFATISTPNGNYAIESYDGEGVLYKIPQRHEVETHDTDELISEINNSRPDDK